jgi:TRAP-type uncharacterized transport system substrate-binding protein
MDSAKLPIWMRIVVVAGLAILAGGASLLAYRWYVRPVTLSVAVGSLDGEAPKILSALASRLAVINAPVRFKVVETTGALESANAFSSGKVDLAVMSATSHRRKPWSCWPRPSRCWSRRLVRPSMTWRA